MNQVLWTVSGHFIPQSSKNKTECSESPPGTEFLCITQPVDHVPGGNTINPNFDLKQSRETILVEMWHNIKPNKSPEVDLTVIADQVGTYILDGLARNKKESYQ